MAEPHVVAALVGKRAEVAGEIEAAERQLDADFRVASEKLRELRERGGTQPAQTLDATVSD